MFFDSIQSAGYHPVSECIRYCIPECRSHVGESLLLHCYCPDLGYFKQVPTLSQTIEADDVPALWREDSKVPGDSQAHFQKYISMSSADFELYPPLDREPVQIIPHLSQDITI